MGELKQDVVDAPGSGLELIETHTAWVFLGERTVWKVKKPVDFGFLNFTTLEQRRTACEAEVRLNARLAPHVYLGVVPITLDSGRHRIEGDGEVVDWAVKMVRLADADRADVLLRQGRLDGSRVEQVAEHVARFHAEMSTNDAISRFGSPEVILGNVRENFAQTRDGIGDHLNASEAQQIETTQLAFVESHRELFEARIRAGRVRDGHGDLRLEHVYFSENSPPTIIDCIEFNERFRYADVCSDVAFLSMDFARLGRIDLAEQFLAAYARASNDYDIYRLVDFYEGYRAYVRAKVASILASDPGADLVTREHARAEARHDYLLALREGRDALLAPVVVAVGGIIASGKSTVAGRLAAMIGAPVVDADRTRKAMRGVTATTKLTDAAWSGAYASDFTDRVYAELLHRADAVVGSKRSVILDASFRTRALRREAQAFARTRGLPFYFVECRVEREASLRRLRHRAEGESVSDGRLEIFDDFVAQWEPVEELPPQEHLVIDTSRPLEETEALLRSVIPTWPLGLNG